MNYTWTITNLYTIDLQNEQGYVVNTLYTVEGVSGNYKASCNGSQQFSVNSSQTNFIPYSQLTNNIVVGWIQESLGVDGVNNIYANIDGQIASMINPPVSPQNTPLPWGS